MALAEPEKMTARALPINKVRRSSSMRGAPAMIDSDHPLILGSRSNCPPESENTVRFPAMYEVVVFTESGACRVLLVDTFSRYVPVLDVRFSYRVENLVQTLEEVCDSRDGL